MNRSIHESNDEISFHINNSRTIVSLVMISIIAITGLSSIWIEKYWKKSLREIFIRKKKIRPSRWFRFKRWILLILLLTINILTIIIMYLYGNERATISIIIFVKAKDIISTLILPFYYFYKILIGYNKKRTKLDGNGKVILSIIPVYKEKIDEICYTMDSIINNSIKMYQILIVIICDGILPDIDCLFDRKELIESNEKYHSWKNHEIHCEIFYGYRQNIPLIILKKNENMEKKDSLILAYDLFSSIRSNASISSIYLRNFLREKIQIFYQINQYDYLFFTDADSFIQPYSLVNLIDELEYRNMDAACGIVLVDFKGHFGGFWKIFQNFQYLYGQFVRRNMENIIGKVSCLPGCITMVKNIDKLSDVICDYSKIPMKNHLFHTTVQRLGTDRRLTHLFLKHQLKTCMVDSAICYTEPPKNWYRLLTQRRRWGSNAFFNSSFNFWSRKIHLLIRISSLFDLIKMSLVFFRLFNIGLFIHQLTTDFNFKGLLIQLSLVVYPRLYFFIFSICKKNIRIILHKVIIGFFINMFLSGLLSTGIMATVFYNIGNFSWGVVNGTSKKKNQLMNVFVIPWDNQSNVTTSTNRTFLGKKRFWPSYKRIYPSE